MNDGLMHLDELRRRIKRYLREKPKKAPPSGTGKSRVIALNDLLLLSGLDRAKSRVRKFLRGGHHYGISMKKMLRLQEVVILCDNHMITKSQVGVYHYHDEPVKPPVKEMKVSLFGKGGVQMLPGVKQVSAPKRMKMPGVGKVFGGN